MGTDHSRENKHVLPYPKGKAHIHYWEQRYTLYNSESMISLVFEDNGAPKSYTKWVYCLGALSQAREVGRG